MSDNKLLMKKLYALAQRGEAYERETAKRKLDMLLKENHLTIDDISDTRKDFYYFTYHTELERKLLYQVIYKVMGANSDYKLYKPSKRNRTQIGTECTPFQKIEIELDFDFYLSAMEEELNYFYEGFVNKMNIFPPDVPHVSTDLSDLSDDEKKDLMKKISYMNDIDYKSRQNLIEDKHEVSSNIR